MNGQRSTNLALQNYKPWLLKLASDDQEILMEAFMTDMEKSRSIRSV